MTPNTTDRPWLSIFAGLPEEEWVSFFKVCHYSFDAQSLEQYSAPYYYDGQEFYFPYRLGYDQAETCHPATERQQALNLCLLTRHHNGFRREEAAAKLLNDKFAHRYEFVLPYLLRLVSEYVYPIISLIYAERQNLPPDQLRRFRDQNPAFIERSRGRASSYWDCYFRFDHPALKDCASIKFLKWLETV